MSEPTGGVIEVDHKVTVIFNGKSVTDRIIASAIDNAALIDCSDIEDVEALISELILHDISPFLITLCELPFVTNDDWARIAQRGYPCVYVFAKSGGTAVGEGCDVGIVRWTPPGIPVAWKGFAGRILMKIAFIYGGWMPEEKNPEDAAAFIADLTVSTPELQMKMCDYLVTSAHGMDKLDRMMIRGHGRLAERERILSAMSADGTLAAMAAHDIALPALLTSVSTTRPACALVSGCML